MTKLSDIFNKKPDFVKRGVKFWKDKDTTNYIKQKRLRGVSAFFMEDTHGFRARILCEKGKRLWEDLVLEDIGCAVDGIKLSRSLNMDLSLEGINQLC